MVAAKAARPDQKPTLLTEGAIHCRFTKGIAPHTFSGVMAICRPYDSGHIRTELVFVGLALYQRRKSYL